MKTRKEALKYLESADIFLTTSKYEGMPISLIEAMLMGVSVIASDCEGNIDVIEHNVNGLLFSDLSQAIQCISELKTNCAKKEMLEMHVCMQTDVLTQKDITMK